MDILELAIQGIRRFNSPLKFTIKDGYNVFFGPSECGKTTLFETIRALLDKKFSLEKSRSFVPWDTVGAPSRAGLVFKVGADTLRIIKDFANATTTLSRAVQGGNYEPLSREPDWIHDHLVSTLGVPSGEVLGQLLMWSALEYQERLSPVRSEILELSLPDESSGLNAEDENYDLSNGVYYSQGDYSEEEAIKKRIEELQNELMLVEQINELQFKVDGLQQEMDEIESKLKEIKVIEEKIVSIDKELEKLKAVENLPAGIDAKVKSLKEQEEAKNRDLLALNKELQYAKQELRKFQGLPFYKDKMFIAGASTAIPFLVAQFVLTILTDNPIIATVTKFFPILWITGWGLLFYTAAKEISRRDKEKKAKKRVEEAQERIKTVEKKYEVEALLLRNLLQQARLSSTEDLLDALENIKMLKEERARLEEEKQALRAKHNLDALLQEKVKLQTEIKEIESRLVNAGGFSNDPNEIRKEIEQLQATLSPQKRSSSQRKPVKKDKAREVVLEKPEGRRGSPLANILKVASDFVKKSPQELLGTAEEVLRSCISSISGGMYTGYRLREDGEVLTLSKGGREFMWDELSPSSKEASYFALKTALLEKIAEFNPLPIILDEPFVFSDDARIVEIAKLLRALSRKTKIIHFTSKPIFAKAGTQVYNLKSV